MTKTSTIFFKLLISIVYDRWKKIGGNSHSEICDTVQAWKWDFDFGGHLATNSKNLVAKLKF